MSTFEEVLIYDAENGGFVGSGIKKVGVDKLQSLNIWVEADRQDFDEQLNRLNDETGVLQHWPSKDDSEVQQILDDPNFEPVPTEIIQVPDLNRSIIQFKRDPLGEPIWDENREEYVVDEDESEIVYRDEVIPQQAFTNQRIKNAQEIVARRRASA